MNQQLKELLDYVVERRRLCVDYRVDKFDPIFKQALEDYDAKPFQRSAGTDLNLPELYVRTEILLSHMLADFFGHVKSPLMPFSRSHDTQKLAQKIQMLWEHRAHQMDFLLKMVPFFRSALLLGTGICYVGWDRQYRKVRKEKPWYYLMGMPMGRKDMHYNEETVNQPCLNVLDIMSCWVDPDAESCDIQKARDFGYDRWMSRAEIERYVVNEDFSEDALNIDWEGVGSRYSQYGGVDTMGQDERRQILDYLPNDGASNVATKQVLVAEWWGEYDFGDGAVSCVVTVADPGGQNILLRPYGKAPRDGNNPYFNPETGEPCKPFVAMNHITRDFCFWGKGLGELLNGLNQEYQEKVNLRLKNVDLAINGMLVYFGSNIVNQNQLQVSPGNKIETRGPIRDTFEFLKFPDISQSISYQIAEIEQSMDEVSGVDAIMRSAPANLGGRTPVSASEISMRQNVASRRFAFTVNMMMAQGPVKIAEMVLRHEKQYMPMKGVEIRQMQQATPTSPMQAQYEKVEPDDLDGDFDFFFVGDPLRVNENIYRNQQVSAIGLLLNPFFAMPTPPGAVVKSWDIAKNLCEAVELPWQEILVSQEQMLQNEVEMMMQQAMQAGAPQGMMPPEQAQPGGVPQQGAGPQLPAIPSETGMRGSDLPPIPSPPSPVSSAPLPEEGGVAV